MVTEQQANRRIAVQALHEADESIRLQGSALQWERDENFNLVLTPKMCACAVIAQGLSIPLLDHDNGSFNYEGVENALGNGSVYEVYRLNDAEAEHGPRYTFSQIGNKLAEMWEVNAFYGLATANPETYTPRFNDDGSADIVRSNGTVAVHFSRDADQHVTAFAVADLISDLLANGGETDD